jgi:hypothetical protein
MRLDDRPVLWSVIAAIAVVVTVVVLAGCATPPEASAPAPHPAFPDDMRLVCHEGAYYLGSVSADQVVRLPLSCT